MINIKICYYKKRNINYLRLRDETMNEIREFNILICGLPTENMYDFGKVINNLSEKIKRIANLIVNYNWDNPQVNIDTRSYGRNILESSLTAILGRIDPFRLITIYKVQSDNSYDLGKRAQTAIEWSGDIIAKSAPTNIWNFEKKKESFDRALLGNHIGDIIWKPAFGALNNYLSTIQMDSDWLAEILSLSEDANFEKAKSSAMRLFSSFSKGVHSECLIDVNTILDVVTLKNLVKDTFKLCTTLSLVSHFVDFLGTTIDKERALRIFIDVEEMIENV